MMACAKWNGAGLIFILTVVLFSRFSLLYYMRSVRYEGIRTESLDWSQPGAPLFLEMKDG